jgi:MFS family permease
MAASGKYTFLGVAANSFFNSSIEVLTVPTFMKAMEDEEGDSLTKMKSAKIADKAATLYSIAISIGFLLGPIIGGGLKDLLGFQRTSDFVCFLSFLFTLIYFVLIIVPKKFSIKI